MTPDLLTRIREALTAYQSLALTYGHSGAAEDAAELLRELPLEPGGAMPDPWPGYLFERADGRRIRVEDLWPGCHFDPPVPHWIVADSERLYGWTPDHIREIRTPDGRVLWRAP